MSLPGVKSGAQWAVESMMANLMKNLPPEIVEKIGQIGENVASFKAQLDRIEQQNKVILDLLAGLNLDTMAIAKGINNGHERTGDERGSGDAQSLAQDR